MSENRYKLQVQEFTEFYHQMIGFVYAGTSCQSVDGSKEYISKFKDSVGGTAILMAGNEGQKDELYTRFVLEKVHKKLKEKASFSPSDLQAPVGGNGSPLMALMVASGVAQRVE